MYQKKVHMMCTKYGFFIKIYTYRITSVGEYNHHQIPCVGYSNIVTISLVQAMYDVVVVERRRENIYDKICNS